MVTTAEKSGRRSRSGNGGKRRAGAVKKTSVRAKSEPAEAEGVPAEEKSVVKAAEEPVAVPAPECADEILPSVCEGGDSGEKAPQPEGGDAFLPEMEAAEEPFRGPGKLDVLREALFSEELEQSAVEQMFSWAGEDGARQESGELSGMALLEAVHHGRYVAGLALRLFEELVPLHGLEERWAGILVQAALWHDLGFAVGGRRGHHKLSMRIIEENTALALSFGLAEEERPLVALLARYHRRAWPSARHRRFAALPEEERKALTRAAALLRVADALDFTHKGAVEEIRVRIRRRSMRIVCLGTRSCRKECRRALKKGDLFEKLFDRRLEFFHAGEGTDDER